GPESLLAEIEIQFATAFLVGLLPGDEGLLAVEGVGLAVPVAIDVAITPERYQDAGPGLDAKTSHQRQITAGRAAHHPDFMRIDVKKFRALAVYPCISVLDILENGRQLNMRRQAIVNGNNRITSLKQRVQQCARFGGQAAVAHDEGAAMNPEYH